MTPDQKHELEALRDAAVAAIDRLNAAIAPFSDKDLEAAGLDIRFFLGMAGLPHNRQSVGNLICTKHEPIPTWPAAKLDYAYERRRLRNSGLDEPLIWERFPAQTFDERAEELERMVAYSRHSRRGTGMRVPALPPAPPVDPLEAFIASQAKRQAQLSGIPAATLAAQPAFRASATDLFTLISSVGA